MYPYNILTFEIFKISFRQFNKLSLFFRAISRYVRLLWTIKGHEKKDRSVADVFRQHVARNPNKPCLIFEDQEWTFQQVCSCGLLICV